MPVPSTAIKQSGLAVTPDGALYVAIEGLSDAEFAYLDGALATNLVAAKAAILGTGGALALGGSLTAVGSIIIGSADLNEADMEKLDGITNGTGAIAKALVLGAAGEISIPGEASLDGNVSATAGAGMTGGAGGVFKTSVLKRGGIIETQYLIDLTGLNGGGTAGDIIGVNGAGAAHMGQITAALNGTILAGTMVCLETPAGSNVDVDLWAAIENTGVEDVAISTLTGEIQLINHGNWAAGEFDDLTDWPTANLYLYLTSGAATDATFTAGKFLITLYGYDA